MCIIFEILVDDCYGLAVVVRRNLFSSFVKKNYILVLFVEDNDSLVKIVQQLLIALVDALCMHENEAHLGDDDVHYYEVECDLNEAGSKLEQAEGILTIHTLA